MSAAADGGFRVMVMGKQQPGAALSQGSPYLVDNGPYRALHFDGRSVQSRMRIDAPNELQFGYTRMMMGFLLFNPAPRDIVIVGLGGGSLSKYCHHQLPGASIVTVEINPEVIALRDSFAIPADDDRFQVVCADAADYLRDRPAIADVILLDGYEHYGLPSALSSAAFYGHCHSALRPGGVVAANLWGSRSTVQTCLQRIRDRFDQKMLKVRSPTSQNIVALGLREPRVAAWPELQRRARALSRETEIDFPYILDEMRASSRAAPWLVKGGSAP